MASRCGRLLIGVLLLAGCCLLAVPAARAQGHMGYAYNETWTWGPQANAYVATTVYPQNWCSYPEYEYDCLWSFTAFVQGQFVRGGTEVGSGWSWRTNWPAEAMMSETIPGGYHCYYSYGYHEASWEIYYGYWSGGGSTNSFNMVCGSGPAPRITNLSPTEVDAGSEVDMNVWGSGFGDSPDVQVSGGDVTVGTVFPGGDTSLSVRLTIGAGASGSKTVYVGVNGVWSIGMAFQVRAPAVCDTPVNFRETGWGTYGEGGLRFTYEWDSSSGRLSDIASCQVGEYVTYPGPGNPYRPTSPPFPNDVGFPNPATEWVYADSGWAPDIHDMEGVFVQPYIEASFTATQSYRWRCSCVDNNAWQYFVTGISIERAVEQVGGSWRFRTSKSGVTNTKPLP